MLLSCLPDEGRVRAEPGSNANRVLNYWKKTSNNQGTEIYLVS